MNNKFTIKNWNTLTIAAENFPYGIYHFSMYSSQFLKNVIFIVEKIILNDFDLNPAINSDEYKLLVVLGMHLDRFEKLHGIPEHLTVLGNTVLYQEELIGFKNSCIHELHHESRNGNLSYHLYSLNKW